MKVTSICCCILLLMGLGSGMASCGAASTEPEGALSAVVLETGRQCLPAPEGWRATWIVTPEALGKMMATCRSNFIPAVPETGFDIDFNRFGVLAVEMGQQPTSGYDFIREGVTASLEGRMVTVSLDYRRPAPDAMTAQVITAPWILIQLPIGRYDGIRVVDREGCLLARVELQE